MASNSPQQPLVLEYSKRRFDGGGEQELIEQIEQQQRLFEQQQYQRYPQCPQTLTEWEQMQHQQYQQQYQKQTNQHRQATATQMPQPTYQQVPPAAPLPVIEEMEPQRCKESVQTKLYRAFVIPYVELFLGCSGLIIGNAMFFSLLKGQMSPEVIREQRRFLLDHSWKVVCNSLVAIALSPIVAIRLLFS